MIEELFGGIPEQNQRSLIIKAIQTRCIALTQCANFQQFLIQTRHDYVIIPSGSPSEPDKTRSKNFVIVRNEFEAPVSYFEDFVKLAESGLKDPNLPLMRSANELFKVGNEFGLNILAYARSLESKLNSEFKAKTFYEGISSKEECADIPELVVFIIERQLGILSSAHGINTTTGPKDAENNFASLQLSSGSRIVWSGPKELVPVRRAFIDEILADKTKTDKFKEEVLQIKVRAQEIQSEVCFLAERIEQAAKQVEIDAQKVANKPKPGFWYNGAEGRIRGDNKAAKFNKGRGRTILEILVIRKAASLDDLIEAIHSTFGNDEDPKKIARAAVQHLNETFEEKGMGLRLLLNEGVYKLSHPVGLDDE